MRKADNIAGEDPGGLHWLHLQPPFSSFFVVVVAGVACACHKNPSSILSRLCFDSIPQASHCAVGWGVACGILSIHMHIQLPNS